MQTEQPLRSVTGATAPPPRERLRAQFDQVRRWSETPRGTIWRDAAWIWLLTRVLFVMLSLLVPALLLPNAAGDLERAITRWGQQDAGHFAYIAAHGYYPLYRTAFWPLFPGLEHVLGPVTADNYLLAGILVANAAFFGVLVALRRLVERELGREVARRAILYLAIFPTAFYFFAPYSESLFLFLAICSFAAMRERRWWLAGLLGLFATLTRSAGALLLVPFAVEFYLALRARKAHWWEAAWATLIPAAAGLYTAYLALNHRDPRPTSTPRLTGAATCMAVGHVRRRRSGHLWRHGKHERIRRDASAAQLRRAAALRRAGRRRAAPAAPELRALRRRRWSSTSRSSPPRTPSPPSRARHGSC